MAGQTEAKAAKRAIVARATYTSAISCRQRKVSGLVVVTANADANSQLLSYGRFKWRIFDVGSGEEEKWHVMYGCLLDFCRITGSCNARHTFQCEAPSGETVKLGLVSSTSVFPRTDSSLSLSLTLSPC